ncbi:hypothetical protein ACFYUD_25075 [Nocardia tengchongensis]|uniref:hypothetical protein n=1 Tax=Nocardia tengchongensis TaxID=2055889 RepID=UPI0036CF87E4
MSDPTVVNSKTRRKAVRSEGPPVHDGDAPIAEVTTVKATDVEAAAATSEAATPEVADTDATTVKTVVTPEVGDDSEDAADAPVAAESAEPADESLEVVEGAPAVAADAEDSEAATAGDESKDGRKWPVLLFGAAAVLCLVALATSLIFWIPAHNTANKDEQLRADYTQTAKQAVLNITTIKVDTVKDDINRVLSVASGQLKDEYSSRSDAYADVIKQANVKASGQVVETAVESYDDHSAQILVAAKQNLTNAGSDQPQQRVYRFRVTITHDGDHFTASKLEFVS